MIFLFMINLSQLQGFNWDDGNAEKNWVKHKITPEECEKVFNDVFLLILYDKLHFKKEIRYYALGKIINNRFLFIAFTVRGDKIRVISARDMNKQERKIYAKN